MGISLKKYYIISLILFFGSVVVVIESKESVLPGARPEPNQSPVPRDYHFCITEETLEEYKNDLANAYDYFKKPLRKTTTDKVRHSRRLQSKCPECGIGKISSVKWFRIVTNLDANEFPIMKYLRQWIHIYIETKVALKGLIVQANANPYGMPYGKFDLEFGCKDCIIEDMDLGHAEKGKALELGLEMGQNKAAAIPCRRRTYLHVRHPYVYVYAHPSGRTQFHMNYNFVDIPCRQTQMMQLMFLMVPQKGNPGYAKTGIIDHGFVDSQDGMPYPYHVDFHRIFSCHTETFDFRLVGMGERSAIRSNADYDACTLASKKEYKENWRDEGKWFISNKVCRWPMRTKCAYEDGDNQTPDITDPTDSDLSTCEDCTDDDNEFTREALRRLIRRSYMTRRVHGIAMIIGLIALGNITIHLSRYWKETGGGCLLVGWWLWGHLGLLYASKFAIYVGLVLGICQADRLPSDESFDIDMKRDQVIKMHKIVGALAVILFHIECLMGPWRPSAPGLRFILVIVHAVIGYLSVVIALVAVILSTACFEVVFVALLMIILSLIFWIAAMVLQILADSGNKMNPSRKYFPVIEAVKVPSKMPFKMVRFALLGGLCALMFICIIYMCLNGGYKGVIFSDACINCIWKYDEWIVADKNKTTTTILPMSSKYKCEPKNGTWDKMISIP